MTLSSEAERQLARLHRFDNGIQVNGNNPDDLAPYRELVEAGLATEEPATLPNWYHYHKIKESIADVMRHKRNMPT
jgi:hypothetical protein